MFVYIFLCSKHYARLKCGQMVKNGERSTEFKNCQKEVCGRMADWKVKVRLPENR